jgi:hypothetical protein
VPLRTSRSSIIVCISVKKKKEKKKKEEEENTAYSTNNSKRKRKKIQIREKSEKQMRKTECKNYVGTCKRWHQEDLSSQKLCLCPSGNLPLKPF